MTGFSVSIAEYSELSQFNAFRGTTPFPISAEIGEVIAHAMEIGELTDGALDVTVGPLVEAWGFGPVNEMVKPPSPAEIEGLLGATGHRHLQLDTQGPTLSKLNPDLRIDLSAVAKGYAIDRVASALSASDYDRFMVEVGGEIRVRGSNPDGEPWRLAVERPQEVGRALHTVVALSEGSLATSGDYRHYREVNGNRISHIIDPRSGRPISHGLASVSVIDELCVRADGLSTALLVLGPEQGFALALELDLPALFLVRDQLGDLRKMATPEFDELMKASD